MEQRAGAIAQAGQFVFQASKTHVDVRATDRRLGMRELAAAMQADPNLHKCVVETCGIVGEAFTARLRIVG